MTASTGTPDAAIPVDDDIVEPHPIWEPSRRRSRARGVYIAGQRRVRRRPQVLVLLCVSWMVMIVMTAIVAQWLPIRNPATVIGSPNVSPSWGREFLGTDAIGRSMVSRLAFGARVSIVIGVAVTSLSLVVGGTLGLLAAYFGGVVNAVIDIIINTILSIPGLLFLLTLIIVLQPTVPVLIWTISIIYIPGFMRLTRANTLSHLQREYIGAARGLGARGSRILVRELLPNTLVVLITYFALVMPNVMLTEGALSYLGFGVQSPTPSWGQMISQGQSQLTIAPLQVIIPCIIFTITVFSIYVLGDWLRARVDITGLNDV